jgi:hypothetical protein
LKRLGEQRTTEPLAVQRSVEREPGQQHGRDLIRCTAR